MSPADLLATLTASAIGAFFAASLGFRYALTRFQKERAFDRRLAWYEKAVGMLLAAYDRINWAIAADLVGASSESAEEARSEAYEALYRLRSLAAEAELYAAPESVDVVRKVSEQVTTIAQLTYGSFKHGESGSPPSSERLLSITGKMLRHAAATLSSDLRRHLGLAAVARPWSIYDHDYREFLEELARHKRDGVDYGNDAWGEITKGTDAVSSEPRRPSA